MVVFTARYGRPLYKADSCGRLEVPPPEGPEFEACIRLRDGSRAGRADAPERRCRNPSPCPGGRGFGCCRTRAWNRGDAGARLGAGHVQRVICAAQSAASDPSRPGRQCETQLVSYRRGGATVRAASSTPTLPADAAVGVTVVEGLDSSPLFTPMATMPPPLQVVSKCSGTSSGTSTSHFPGAYEPAALASSAAYDYQPLLSQAREGQGNTLALVEFSNYDASPVQTYQNCYSIQVPITDIAVNGGATDSNGAAEVQMDEEIAAANAPGLDGIYAYNAANGTGFGSVIDRIMADRATTHANEISISWGACEDAMDPAEVTAADAEFRLAAAAGLSVFAASGGDGPPDCEPFNGTAGPAVDFPASDPWVTGVGGTTLTTSATGANRETSWGQPATFSGGGGGGGVSSVFSMPAWQTGAGVNEPGYSSSTACGQTVLLCRQVPDVALDANPDSGYVLRVTTPAGNMWAQLGGTSAGAPLLAAITADVNTSSVAAGGQALGFPHPL